MPRTVTALLFAIVLAGTVAAVRAPWLQEPVAQDPVPRPLPPPDGAPPPTIVDEPFVTPIPRLDLPGRFDVPDPVEGFWELRARTIGGQLVDAGRGFLAISRTLVMVQLFVRDPGAEYPLLRAGTYRWQRLGEDRVQLTLVIGHLNVASGELQLEPHGRVELRRFELLGDFLRVHQPNGDYLEFARRP